MRWPLVLLMPLFLPSLAQALYILPNERISLPFGTYALAKDLKLEPFTVTKPMYQVRTKFGFIACLPSDACILSRGNFVLIQELTIGSPIAIDPFIGIQYEEPNDAVIIDEQKIIETLNTFGIPHGARRDRIISWLHEHLFLPLKLCDWRTPYLIRVLGFLLSEGRLSIPKDGRPRIDVYAKKEIVARVRDDLSMFGIPSSMFIKEEPFKQTPNFHSHQGISKTCRLEIASTPSVALFHALGFPLGKRGEQKLEIPAWILDDASRWQQQLFLSAYLSSRMAMSTARTKYHFNGIFIQLSQRTPYADFGIMFHEQLKQLVSSFDIETSAVTSFDDYSTPNTTRIRFKIRDNDENIVRLFSTFDFAYHPEKRARANLAICYLRYKKLFVTEYPFIHTTNFPTWDEFIQQQQLLDERTGVVDEIADIESMNSLGPLYDTRALSKNYQQTCTISNMVVAHHAHK